MKKDELKKNNGAEGVPAYVQYKDKVYDVSESKKWKNGIHMNRHKAGEDLTAAMSAAPHGEEVFKKVKFVCGLEQEEVCFNKYDKQQLLYKKYHPHPVFVHFPMGMLFFGALMQALFHIFKESSFETSAFHSTVCGTLALFPTIAFGAYSWWLNYEYKFTLIFKSKFLLSTLIVIFSLFIVILRFVNTEISYSNSTSSLIYNLFIFVNLPILMTLGFLGGKLTWPT